jgi:predicted RNA-binding protein YlxR (DUF448 family)
VSRVGHVAVRTCLGCGARAPKDDLLRVVLATGGLAADPHQRRGGRGGYLHRDRRCWTDFARRKGNIRALRAAIDRPTRAAFVAQLGEGAAEG